MAFDEHFRQIGLMAASRILLGSVNGEITTVISDASTNYINNLKAAKP